MAKNSYQYVEDLKDYLVSPSTEKAKVMKAYTVFQDVFGVDFKIESDALGADGYVEGKLVLELKTHHRDWLSGLFQALHYKKKGLSYPYVVVMSHKFLAIWRLIPDEKNQVPGLPPFALDFATDASPYEAPSAIGKQLAANITKAQEKELLESALFKIDESDFKLSKKETEAKFRDTSLGGLSVFVLHEFRNRLRNLEAARVQINTQNFIQTIAYMERFFPTTMQAVHAFYDMVNYWDITSKVPPPNEYEPNQEALRIVGRNGGSLSEPIVIAKEHHEAFRKFVESRFIFTNEGSGLTLDYYFSRFDEALAKVDPEYVKQHGIFFTDDALAKFALWFVQEYFDKQLSDKYIVIDPAGGSGNLVTSWAIPLKHKIVSELQPDLLRIIERRLRFDPMQREQGFTVVPKTHEGKGLNFLDKSAAAYLDILKNALAEKNIKLDKPLAFLLNPPYKNTDEHEDQRGDVQAHYDVDADIMALTGTDAAKERYLAFIAQVLLMARQQVAEFPGIKPLMMIFTPTSWLIPRPTYQAFRQMFDQEFAYENGFMVKAGEFFKLPGSGNWPVTFTLWRYDPQPGRQNNIRLFDFTDWTHEDLTEVNLNDREALFRGALREALLSKRDVRHMRMRASIRDFIPHLGDRTQTRYDFSRAKKKEEKGLLVSGFPKKDEYNHYKLSRTCGNTLGAFFAVMDNNSVLRIGQDRHNRMSNEPDRIWFRLEHDIKSTNKCRLISAPADKSSYCAYDLASAQALLSWFAITKVLGGKFPLWMNQYDIWPPSIPADRAAAYHALCFAFGLVENRCIVTRFEADNPVPGAPAIFLDNPLAPTHPDNFWRNVLAPHATQHPAAKALVQAVTDLYRYWDAEITKGRHDAYGHGMEDEPYFKYFDYKPFVTPYAGLLQMRKLAQSQGHAGLLERLEALNKPRKQVMDALYAMLVDEFGYFD